MTLINQNWLNLNGSRRYPLDDNATGLGDDGTKLKDDVVLDLNLRWPLELGAYAFLGGVTVGPRIVTAVFLAADNLTTTSTFTPIAAITVVKPVTPTRYYALTPLVAGVGGFIIFGDTDEDFQIRFSTPAQGLLAPRVATGVAALPISRMRKEGRVDGLINMIKLTAGSDLEIFGDTRNVAGEPHDAIVFRLKNPTTARNILSDYIGPCGARPESRNCERLGVETINGVGPACNGNIQIIFQKMVTSMYSGCGSLGGVTIDQSLGIDDVCINRQLLENYEPSEGCAYFSTSSETNPFDPNPGGGDNPVSSLTNCASLPFVDCFAEAKHPQWQQLSGASAVATITNSSEKGELAPSCTDNWGLQLQSTATRNILVWNNCSYPSTMNTRVHTNIQFIPGGFETNAGVILNYRPGYAEQPITTYHLVLLDRKNQSVDVLRYNGTTFVQEHHVTLDENFALFAWYATRATLTPGGGVGLTALRVEVYDVDNPSWPAVDFTFSTSQLGNLDGHHGLYSNRSFANISFWRLTDV